MHTTQCHFLKNAVQRFTVTSYIAGVLSHQHLNCGITTHTCECGAMYLHCIQEVQRRFPDGLPQLDPVQDMNIRDDDFKSIIRVSRILAIIK